MPTQTDPSLAAHRPALDSPTAAVPAVQSGGHRTPAVFPTSVTPYEPSDELAAVLAEAPGLPVEPRPEWATTHLSPLAAVLHSLACACEWGGDAEGHGADFEHLAEAVRDGVLDEDGRPAAAPVEAKVWAGTWGTLAASMGLALVTLLLDRLDVLPSLLGGEHPWAGPLVLVLGVVLPPAASFLRGYLAEHTARATDVAE